jgi:hypothetical protein
MVTGEIMTAISTVGFPIAMCIVLFVYLQKESAANREQIYKVSESFTKALNDNTEVMTKLLERIDVDG